MRGEGALPKGGRSPRRSLKTSPKAASDPGEEKGKIVRKLAKQGGKKAPWEREWKKRRPYIRGCALLTVS